jgi:hypothetical protein
VADDPDLSLTARLGGHDRIEEEGDVRDAVVDPFLHPSVQFVWRVALPPTQPCRNDLGVVESRDNVAVASEVAG